MSYTTSTPTPPISLNHVLFAMLFTHYKPYGIDSVSIFLARGIFTLGMALELTFCLGL